jgi:hypothetical protein
MRSDEQLKALSPGQLIELHRLDKEQWYRAWKLQNDPSFVLSEKENTLREREKALELAEREKDLKRREEALTAPPAPPAQRVVSHEAISKETLEQICKKRGVTKRQFTDDELKRLPVNETRHQKKSSYSAARFGMTTYSERKIPRRCGNRFPISSS